jgi:hypothetical protein
VLVVANGNHGDFIMASSVKTPGTKPNEIPDQALTVDDEGKKREGEAIMRHRRQRFQVMQTFWSEIHSQGLKDDKFVAGEHWDKQVKQEREEARRPVLTYNLLPAFNRQITNRVRQDRPTIKVTPIETNAGADPRLANIAGSKDYSMAEVYAGIIKNIEHVSRADQAYDTALKHAVDHGFGYFYLIPQWSKLDPFVQELVIHRVKNSYSIMLDPDAEEVDFRDMQDAFMFSNINKDTFQAKYPGVPYTEFATTAMGTAYEGWYDAQHVRISQYFYLDHRDDEALMMSNGKIFYRSDVEKVLDDLENEFGVHIMTNDSGDEMRKKVKRPVCMWEKMTADQILEGPIELPFSSIPIFPVLGEEMLVDSRTRYESAIRHATDAAKSYNYWRTAAAETVALAPRAPWMISSRQIKGHEHMYENANTDNHPYLLYNHVEGESPPKRLFASTVAAAELQNASQDAVDMQTIIGLHDASLGKESNEKSGKAILARQNQGSISTFQFPDNLGRALEQCGRCQVEAIPRIMDTKRIARIRLPDGSDDFIMINQSVKDKETGEDVLVHDIAYGKYDVTLETGPSYATQRQEASALQMDLLKVLGPDRAANIVHLIVQNLGVPGSEEVAAVLRKMLPDALKTEDEKMADLPKGITKDPESGQLVDEDGKPWQPEPTLDQQLMQKQQEIDELKANVEQQEAAAKSKKADADIAAANAKLAEAELAMEQLKTGAGEQQKTDDMMTRIKEIIEETMDDHATNPNAHAAMNIEEKIANAIVEALNRVRGFVDRQVKDGAIVPVDSPSASDGNKTDTKQSQEPMMGPIIFKAEPVFQEAKKPDRIKIVPADDGTGAMIATPEWNDDDAEQG